MGNKPTPKRIKEVQKLIDDLLNERSDGLVLVVKLDEQKGGYKTDGLVHAHNVPAIVMYDIISKQLEIDPIGLMAYKMVKE